MKYYIADDGDYVETLDCFKEELIEDDLEEMELLEMKRDIGGEMYCHKKEYFVEKGDCGKFCTIYLPCNGKSGRCRNLENGFRITGRRFLLTKDGLKEASHHDKVQS